MTPAPASRSALPSRLLQPTADAPAYTGRFAPSPTGPLHFGSLVAALGSFLDARAHGGRWLVRIEDLDPPREAPAAADAILRVLETFGLCWDGPVLYQHTRLNAYQTALDRISSAGRTYPCACSRREIADSGVRGLEGPVYPGTCRHGWSSGKHPRAIRVRVPDDGILEFHDMLQGTTRQNLALDIGDFVLRRADGCFAYQLAVVVDDAFQQVTHVVRGADLLLSTPRQIYLQRLLGLPTPIYMHLPVVMTASGDKLSKQTGATALATTHPSQPLAEALRFLGLLPPPELSNAPTGPLLVWATENWHESALWNRATSAGRP